MTINLCHDWRFDQNEREKKNKIRNEFYGRDSNNRFMFYDIKNVWRNVQRYER